MIRRLLMAILIACLASPAIAMPVAQHEPRAETAKGHCGDNKPAKEDDGKAVAPHGCIGCLAPLHGLTATAAPVLPPAIAHLPLRMSQLSGSANAPETPPPRA